MSRLTGPRIKKMRALGVELPGLSRKSIENKPFPPGQHGNAATKRRKSDYAIKLAEKQKIRFNYGLTERQMRRLIVDARKGQSPTGEQLIQLLERRLDNVVFRAGFAPTVIAARQLVSHGHIQLNGKKTTIPSIRLKKGDVVSIREKSRTMPMVAESIEAPSLIRPEWLSWADSSAAATVVHYPGVLDVPFPIDLQLVIEFYANRV